MKLLSCTTLLYFLLNILYLFPFFLAPCVLGQQPEALSLLMGQNRAGGYYSNYNRPPNIGFNYTRPNIFGGVSSFSYGGVSSYGYGGVTTSYNQGYYIRPNLYGGFNTYNNGNSNFYRGGYVGNSIYYNGGRYDSRNGNR